MKKLAFIMFIACSAVISCGQSSSFNDQSDFKTGKTEKLSYATFAAGCFWCEEAIFESLKGVKEAISGYAGGTNLNPTYYNLGSGPSCHAEMVNISYDSSVIDYPTLLRVYFASQDPTQVNGQGPDIGQQYRSVVFYRNTKEKEMTENMIQELQGSGKYKNPINVEIVAFTKFWEAEAEHQNFVRNHPNYPYVVHESIPRIRRFQRLFPELIKPDQKY